MCVLGMAANAWEKPYHTIELGKHCCIAPSAPGAILQPPSHGPTLAPMKPLSNPAHGMNRIGNGPSLCLSNSNWEKVRFYAIRVNSGP